MLDLNGEFKFSKILSFSLKGIGVNFGIYPNPTIDRINISYTVDKNTSVNIEVFDATGKTFIRKAAQLQQGTSLLELPLNHLSQGNYWLKAKGQFDEQRISFVVQ